MSQKPSCLTSRRHFIKSSGITALSAPFVTSGLLADPPSERLRHASFGASGMAGADIGSLSRSKHFELAAVADVDLKRAEGIRKRFPKAKFYQDWRELLDKERILAVSKSDMLDEELKAEIAKELPKDLPSLFISSAAQQGLTELKDLIWQKLNE